MTTTVPACPSWCTRPEPHGFSDYLTDGTPVRDHETAVGIVARAPQMDNQGRPEERTVTVDLTTNELDTGSGYLREPVRVSVHGLDWDPDFTPDEARTLARILSQAADMADACN